MKNIVLGVVMIGSVLNQSYAYDREYVVVGGGIAGLTAASKLTKENKDVALFEAGDRLGGRMYTHYWNDGSYMELGGQFIDEDHTYLKELVHTSNVELVQQQTIVSAPKWKNVAATAKLHKEILLIAQKISSFLEEAEKYNNFGEILDELCDGTTEVRSYFECRIESLCGINSSALTPYYVYEVAKNLEGLCELITSGQSFLSQAEFIKGGNKVLIDKLGDTIGADRIQLAHKLLSIKKVNDEYQLTFAPNVVISCKYLIMAIPFSTLRDVALDESLNILDEQKNVIETLPYGTNAKVIVPTKNNPFAGKPSEVVHDSAFICLWNNTVEGNKPSITYFLGGDKGAQNNYDLDAYLAATNQHIFPEFEKDESREILFKSWAHEPLFKGSYSEIGPQQSQYLEESSFLNYGGVKLHGFAQPLNNNTLFFIGEHVSAKYQGYMEGAVRSAHAAISVLLN
jgi:monoamine oxidase